MAQPKLQRKVFATILGSLPTQAQNHPIPPPVKEMVQWSSGVKNFLAGYHAFYQLSTYDYDVQLFQYNQFSSLGKAVSLVANDEEGLLAVVSEAESKGGISNSQRPETMLSRLWVDTLPGRQD